MEDREMLGLLKKVNETALSICDTIGNILKAKKERERVSVKGECNWVVFTEDGFGFPTWEAKAWHGYLGLNWDNTVKVFFYKNDAEEYILLNKPVLSLKDIYDRTLLIGSDGSKLRELVKSRLNGKA